MVGPAVLIPKTGTRWNPELIVNELFDFYFRVFLTQSNVSFLQEKVVIMRQHGSPNRITNRYDHYCPKATLPVYCSIYQKYKRCGKLTPLRKAVLEKKILFQLYKAESRKWSEWTKYAGHVDRKHVKTYFWYKAFGLSGFVRSLGVIRGIKTFCFLNKLMLRAPH